MDKLDKYCKGCVLRYTAQNDKDEYLEKISSSDPPLSPFSCYHDYLTKEHSVLLSPLTLKSMLPVVTVAPQSTDALVSLPSQCCYLCAGLLQPYTIVQIVNHILSDIKRLQYHLTSFNVTCTNLVHFHVRTHIAGVGKPAIYVKTAFKWLLARALEKTLGVQHENETKDSNSLQIQVKLQMDAAELLFLRQFNPNVYQSKIGKYNTPFILNFLEKNKEELTEFRNTPGSNFKLTTVLVNSPLYLGGRYTKHSRFISQTPWLVDDDVQRVVTSVEDVIATPVKKALCADDIKLHASGREDIDVRMLGTGRPFYLQVINGRRIPSQNELDLLQASINASGQKVKCSDLTVVTRGQCDKVKNAEVDKTKEYRCIIKTTRPLTPSMMSIVNSISNLTLKQNTPVRVLHRRAPLIRDKVIYSVQAEKLTLAQVQYTLKQMKSSLSMEEAQVLTDHLMVARVQAEAGTYIKEFVHGDFSRTIPSIGTLLDCKADLLQLDVEKVAMDWPPEELMETES